MSKVKKPTKAELLAEIDGLVVAGVSLSKETFVKFLNNDEDCFQIALSEQNQELRTAMLGMLCHNEGGNFTNLIANRGFQFVDKNLIDNDYEFAEVMSFPFGDAKTPIYVLKLINRTTEPAPETMTEEEKIAAGLTEDGYKIYLLGVTNEHEQPYAIVKSGPNEGKHPLTSCLVPTVDRNGVLRRSQTWWANNEPADNLIFKTEKVTLRSKLDFVGYTFGLYPGEYHPDAEA